MIRRKNEMREQVRDNIRGGSGRIENLHIFEPEELGGKCTLWSVFELDPGDSIGGHAHDSDGEIYYVLSGELVVTEDGAEHVLRAGDASYTAGGSSHAIENRSGKKASFMAIILPWAVGKTQTAACAGNSFAKYVGDKNRIGTWQEKQMMVLYLGSHIAG